MADTFKKDVLDILASMRDFLSDEFTKQDTTQERAKVSKPPKAGDTQEALKGGDMPGEFKPAAGLTKQELGEQGSSDTDEEIKPEGKPEIEKQDDDEEEEVKEDVEKQDIPEEEEDLEEEELPLEDQAEDWEEEEEEELDEMKALLKDIRTALVGLRKQKDGINITKNVLKKAVRDGVANEMRKMGFHPTTADVKRIDLGADERDVPSSKAQKPEEIVDELSKYSWRQLAAIREKEGDLTPYKGYSPAE